MIRVRIAATFVLGTALLGCGGGGDEAWQGTVEDSAGVEIVTSTGDGLWGPDEGWTVEQELVIGQAAGEPEYQFGQIAGIDVGSDGRIYVMDQQAREVRVFDPEGAFSHTMGQAGSGPGELSQAAGPVFVGPGDTVQVPDIMLQRVNRYTAEGETAESYPVPMTGGIAAKWMEGPDERLIQQAMVMQLPNQPQVDQKNLLLRRSSTGEVTDTLLEMPIGKSVDLSGSQPSFTIFEAEPMWSVGPEGRLYFGINADYRIEVRSPDGDLVRVVRKEVERQPISDSDEAEYRRVLVDLWREQGMPPQSVEMMKQALSFAEHYPAYANFVGGPDATLWVQRIQTPDEVAASGGTFDLQDLGSATWEVFDDQGRLLGPLQMPPRFSPILFKDGAIYGVLRDDMDVQYVARMLIRRGEAELAG